MNLLYSLILLIFVTSSHSLFNNKVYKLVPNKLIRNTKLSLRIQMNSQGYDSKMSINSSSNNIVKSMLSNVKNMVGSSAKVLVSTTAMVLIYLIISINVFTFCSY